MKSLRSPIVLLPFSLALAARLVAADSGGPLGGDPVRGKAFFQQNCALCHATSAGGGQGPSLVGVVGRKAATTNFGYSTPLANSGLTWDPATLDHFLASPSLAVPGTVMPVPVPNDGDRHDLIAYLATLKSESDLPPAPVLAAPAVAPGVDLADWRNDAPGKTHRVVLTALPPPFQTPSAGNGPKVVARPAGAEVHVPPGFAVHEYATGLNGPRLLRVAPNGDLFVAETGAGRVRVLRAPDGAADPEQDEIFAFGLDRPFGLAFYPAGPNPQWLYVANNNEVVRFPYQNGDLKARGGAQVIVPHLSDTTGGHTTRDVAFSLDGQRLFISVGSGSNVAEDMKRKDPADIAAWEAAHGRGAAWGPEENRADVVVTDPEGHAPIRPFATGIRNGVGLAVDPDSGELWTATNERDGLGDNLVPDYVTSVKEHAYYGWPWYYMGNHEDPRHAGERPDLAGTATVPDVPIQAHSAALELVFYPAATGPAAFPAEYRGDIFVALHGSWNRASRTGYKVIRIHRNRGTLTGEYEDFLTGFVVDGTSVWGRPVGVAVAHDGALIVSEDGNGTLWRITPAAR